IPTILQTISKDLKDKNAKTILVGGFVRDHFLGLASKDYDVEVYGLEHLEEILAVYGSVNLVGKSFGVLKFVYEHEEYDFSFPRTESKSGKGHRGFDVAVDGSLSYEVAARRRDFTLNALGYDIAGEQFIDPFGGVADIEQKLLRHIDEVTFVEDPLRVYRAVQFCARFGYTLTTQTKALCLKMVEQGMLEELPKERIYIEWQKLLLKSPKPSIGFELMRELGILKRYFPELHALIGVPQSPKWHPEGDVWIHTMMTVDAMAKELKILNEKLGIDDRQKLKFLFAILCHDLGKATHTSIEEDGRIRAIGHEAAGIEPTKSLLYRLSDEHDFIASLLPLVEHHLKPSQFYAGKAKASAFRRLASRVNIEELVVVAKADFLGRTTKESLLGVYHAGEWMLEKAKAYNVSQKPLEPLLQGRDLIDLGLEPSPKFKEILDEVYQQQVEGKVTTKEEALSYVKGNFNNR
ncbi:MAG: HD domain-containing protein, partial [Sulfurovum sp.]|nr:HD domain-containing protein [Sulfurovum sp.]